MEVLRRRADVWLGGPAVQGVEIGAKIVGGRDTGTLAVVVLVDRKRARAKVAYPVPRSLALPGLGPVPTDVVAIGRIVPQQFTERVRPAMPGCSIGHRAMTTMGTLGLVVRRSAVLHDARRTASFILGNSHVLARSGMARRGDAVIQPGPGDAGSRGGAAAIARLEEWVPFDFTSRGWPNLVDAAIARVARGSDVTRRIRQIKVMPRGVSFELAPGMRVHKVGRTTDHTAGTVLCTGTRIKLEFLKTRRRTAPVRFREQVRCTRYSSPGDSGAAVLNERNEVVGLHMAGTSTTSFFNKIEHVFALLDITLA